MTRRGAILFEVLLSIALFVGAAAFALRATRNGAERLDRLRREQLAVDLVRSTMSELEAGLIAFNDLRDGVRSRIGSQNRDGVSPADPTEPAWVFEVESSPTAHAGLSLVTITVTESGSMQSPASATLRQMMPLREGRTEEFREDDLLDGLADDPEPAFP